MNEQPEHGVLSEGMPASLVERLATACARSALLCHESRRIVSASVARREAYQLYLQAEVEQHRVLAYQLHSLSS